MNDRPNVSLIVPFAGDDAHARELAAALGRLQLRAGDEVIVVDNGGGGATALVPPVRVVRADAQRSSYYARNVGAENALSDWLLFMDSDCMPVPDLLDRYFSAPVTENVGALAGDVLDAADQDAVVARYTASRELLDADRNIEFEYKPAAITANLMVRRAAWSSIGGFLEGIRSGGDSDFSWRLQDAGWELRRAPGAAVEHRHRESLGALLAQKTRYGSSQAWLMRRYPGSYPPIRAWLEAPRAVLGALKWILRGDRDRAAFRLLDAAGSVAQFRGAMRSNAAQSEAESLPAAAPGSAAGDVAGAGRGRRIAILADRFPEVSETFIAQEALALERLGWDVRIEATNRALRPNRAAGRVLRASYIEDEPASARVVALAWLAARHPLALATDLFARARWRRQEPVLPLRAIAPLARRCARDGVVHLHAHFAAEAALTALRLHRVLGVPYSVTAHAYDIYLDVRNLEEKLREAAFATSGCDYTVSDLRDIAPAAAGRIHKVIMGVDVERMRRRTPYPGERRIVSVGRLVEKKGFADLIAAIGLLHERGSAMDDVALIGDGPLRDQLATQIDAAGLSGVVRLVGARQPEDALAQIEQADVFCLPCVVAQNGDRDSMPVVVKEALALELPVVVTDEVGLPELVGPEWGTLVPPHDPAALADALEQMLRRPPAERAAMGKRGREFVAEHCNVDAETARLSALIDEALR